MPQTTQRDLRDAQLYPKKTSKKCQTATNQNEKCYADYAENMLIVPISSELSA